MIPLIRSVFIISLVLISMAIEAQTDAKRKVIEIKLVNNSDTLCNYNVCLAYSRSQIRDQEFVENKKGKVNTKYLYFVSPGIYYFAVYKDCGHASDSTARTDPFVEAVLINSESDRIIREIDVSKF